MEPFTFRQGTTPLLVGMPHIGTAIPEDIARGMTEAALTVPDTDWHLDRLYDFLDEIGASVLAAAWSRYVVDTNRPPDGPDLYPGEDTTGVVPLDTFDRAPLYRPGAAPDAAEVARRIDTYWRPYHGKIQKELERLKAAHGYALMWEAHSIRNVVPRFFDGRLPDLNLGTVNGASCAPDLAARLYEIAQGSEYDAVLDGRFMGGHIVRAHGDPAGGVQAVQLELSQATYMDEAPPVAFREEWGAALRPTLRALIDAMLAWADGRS